MRNGKPLGFVLTTMIAVFGCETSKSPSSGHGGARTDTASGGATQAGGAAATNGGQAGSAATAATSGGFAGNAGAASGNGGSAGNAGAAGAAAMSFFVTSDTNATGDLGGLVGADARCQRLAAAVGFGAGLWRAYLSAESDPANSGQPTNARDRIGAGPWYNRNGVLIARNLAELDGLRGNPDLFVDERGMRINGQWANSPTPNQHDILTGSTPNGAVMVGHTCESWTSSSSTLTAQVGHSDGLGPSMNPNPPYDSWNSSHANGSCADTAPKGGAGKLYCFRVN